MKTKILLLCAALVLAAGCSSTPHYDVSNPPGNGSPSGINPVLPSEQLLPR